MRKVVVVLVSLALSALVAGFCVSAIRASHQAEARQETQQVTQQKTRRHTMPPDAIPPRIKDAWRNVPTYELDEVWPF
jgi:hypothetical protein